MTRGGKGALFSIEGKLYEQGIKKTEVVDTMGAGDAFISAFLVDFVGSQGLQARTEQQREEKIRHALAYASSWAAKACMTPGAFGHGCKIASED